MKRRPPETPPPRDSATRLHLAAAAALAACVFLVFFPALRFGFVNWDDGLYVYDNHAIRSLASLHWASPAALQGYWHPLTILSYALDYAVWGLTPAGYHLTNVFLHAINTVLVFRLAQRLLEAPGRRNLFAAFVAAFLFGAHPLRAEPVAWIAGRKELLCGFFSLLSALAYVGYASARPGMRALRYLASFTFFLGALSSKPAAAALPAVFLLLDYYPLRRMPPSANQDGDGPRMGRLLSEKIPFFALSLLSVAVSLWTHGKSGILVSTQSISLGARFALAVYSPIFYLHKTAFPLSLAPLYPPPPAMQSSGPALLLALAALIVISVVCMRAAWRGNRIFLTTWLYYLISLLPVIGFVQVGGSVLADRYTYLPSVGPCILAGIGAGAVAAHARAAGLKAALAALALASGSLLSWQTVRQQSIWKDSLSLWSHETRLYPGRLAQAHNNLGVAYMERGRLAEAAEEYRTVIRLDPGSPIARSNLGNVYTQMRRWEPAIQEYEAAIRLKPDYELAYNNLGVAYAGLGRLEEAARAYLAAMRLRPDFTDPHFNLGLLYRNAGRREDAAREFAAALRLNPGHEAARINLELLRRTGR